jgi:hypothetical protein
MNATPDASAAFEQWAKLQPWHPRDVLSLMHDVERSDEHVGLLATQVQGRRLVWKSAPFAGKARISFSSVEIGTIDAWAVDAASLRTSSDHIAMCERCDFSGKIGCAACGAAGKTLCSACGGQRKVYGYAANGSRRLLNCQNCRGKGEVDCGQCRRGIGACDTCKGEGRLQKWVEVEGWNRSVTTEYPRETAVSLGIDGASRDAAVERDAEIVADHSRPHRLSPQDLGSVPATWLTQLQPALAPGERVSAQRLRIARIPRFTVSYGVGRDEDQITFLGRQAIASQGSSPNAFTRRASTLRTAAFLLALVGVVFILVALGRGRFYWSVPTLLSIAAFFGMLACVEGGVADWTLSRSRQKQWLLGAVGCLAVAFGMTVAALPRRIHAQSLITSGKLADAELELNALGGRADAHDWAALRLARIGRSDDISEARETLTKIPNELAEHSAAEAAVDRLVLRKATEQIANQAWPLAATSLSLLSPAARTRPESSRAAAAAYIPLARTEIARSNWHAAADGIVTARSFGIGDDELQPLTDSIHVAAEKMVHNAAADDDPVQRFSTRLSAEDALIRWEIASGNWGTPPLVALRTSMARDVAILERRRR